MTAAVHPAPSRRPPHPWLGLAVALAVVYVAAAVGALGSMDAKTFYAQLSLPSWAPPAGVFGPVWSTLYTMMGVAAWLVWRRTEAPIRRTALMLFAVQLAANVLWSWLFFHWRIGAAAFVEVVVLWLLIVATLLAFRRASALAAALMLPYLLWVSFAAVLTLTVWRMNPGLL